MSLDRLKVDLSQADLEHLLGLMARRWRIDALHNMVDLKSYDKHQKSVTEYYTQTSEREYRDFISKEGAVHYGLSTADTYRPDDLLAQAKFVSAQIEDLGAKRVLEVGCGKGFNLLWLAEHHRSVLFHGRDLTPLHVRLAQERAKGRGLENVAIEPGDHRKIEAPSGHYDVIYAVETLCYLDSVEKRRQFFSEAARVLRREGRLVVFDFFRADDFESRPHSLRAAVELVEAAFVLDAFASRQGFSSGAAKHDLRQIGFRSLNEPIMPMVLRLHRYVRVYLEWLHLIKVMKYLGERLRGAAREDRRYRELNKAHLVVLPHVFRLGVLEYNQYVFSKSA
jgi:cyclopropane fatty-acyl-phospholipid synthase-like methyltransferase